MKPVMFVVAAAAIGWVSWRPLHQPGSHGFWRTVFLLLTARADEAEMIARFGADYRRYMAHTRRFVPFLF